MEKPAGGSLRDIVIGPALQCAEAASLGMPFEVWKTYMGRNRGVGTFQALGEIYAKGGLGMFWRGTGPKMAESASKGMILVYSKEALLDAMTPLQLGAGVTGAIAGAGAGVCQVTVMGPMTFLVTGAVTGNQAESTWQRVHRVYAKEGVKGFYPGGVPIAFRQMTNWASRQGFTELAREQVKKVFHGGNLDARLTKGEEIMAGVGGGILASWNHPFEVARIEMQARADQGQSKKGMISVFRMIVQEQGPQGLFKGIIPRMCLSIWQVLFMVSGVKVVKAYLDDNATK
jgi:hypothetical protein